MARTNPSTIFVYVDRTHDGHVFYVGKGNSGRVANLRRNEKHQRISARHGIHREVVWETDDEMQASAYEQQLITFFDTYTTDWSNQTIACNFTTGGDGVSGHKHTNESRQKMSLAAKGRPGPNVGRTFSESHRRNISLAKKGFTFELTDEQKARITAVWRGRRHSLEARAKMSESALKREARKRDLKTLRDESIEGSASCPE